MTRKIKALGLVLVAVLAMSAVAAAGAQAENIEHTFKSDSENEKTNLTGVAESEHIFTIEESLTTTCEEIKFDGTVVGNEVDEVTIKPTYDKCKVEPLGEAIVTENDCAYMFDSDTTTTEGVENPHARVTVECAEENAIEIGLPSVGITITVGTTDENHNLHGVRYDNVKETIETEDETKHEVEAITVDATVENIHWECDPVILCGFLGIKATGTDGTYFGKTTVTGYEDIGTATNPTTPELTHGDPVNIKMTTP